MGTVFKYLFLLIFCSMLISCTSIDKEFRTAAQTGDLSTIKTLIVSGVNVNSKGKDGQTALMQASLMGNSEIVLALLVSGVDVNAKNNAGATALMYASSFGNLGIVDALILKRAEVNAKDNNGWTSLMLASLGGYKNVIKKLLDSGAEIDAKHRDGSTALMMASLKSYSENVKILLEAGANVNAKNNNGWTALMFAYQKNCRKIVDLLIETGANVNAKNNNGETVFDISNHEEKKELMPIAEDTLILFSGNEPAIIAPSYDIEILKVDGQKVKISPNRSSKYCYSSVAIEPGNHRLIVNLPNWDEGSIFFIDTFVVSGQLYSLKFEITAKKFSFGVSCDVWIEDIVTGERVSTYYRKNL